jgi:acyl transferase domain-containing protein
MGQTEPASNFRSICYTTCLRREHYRYRFAYVVSNMGNLIKVLEDRLHDSMSRSSSSRATSSDPVSAACHIAFAFPGQGSRYQAMSSDLIDRYPGFKVILDSAASAASVLSGYPISVPILFGAIFMIFIVVAVLGHFFFTSFASLFS